MMQLRRHEDGAIEVEPLTIYIGPNERISRSICFKEGVFRSLWI